MSCKYNTTLIACKFKRHFYNLLRVCHLIVSIIHGRVYVYNKKVDSNPEYYVDDVLVHNCGMCASMEGEIMKVEEARGLIPRHPSCRCAWVPEPITAATPKEDLRDAVNRSIDKERVKGSLASKKRQSTWAGKDLLRGK